MDTFSVARALNLCTGSGDEYRGGGLRSIYLDFTGWQERAFKDSKPHREVSPSYRKGGPVDRWLADPPASLEHVELDNLSKAEVEEFFGPRNSERWRGIFDIGKLPRVRSLSPFSFEACEVAEWPDDRRTQFECVNLYNHNIASVQWTELVRMLQLLPNVRRLAWSILQLGNDGLANVVQATREHGALESLYISAYSSTVNLAAVYQLSNRLKEFVFADDNDSFVTHDGRLLADPGLLSDADSRLQHAYATAMVSKRLPRTTVTICPCLECIASPMDRHFLPSVLERWQLSSLGPLHNSADPETLQLLEDERRRAQV